MSLLTENNVRAAFIALSRALDPREAPKQPEGVNYADNEFRRALAKYEGEVKQREGIAIQSALTIVEDVAILFQRFVVSQEAIASALIKRANPLQSTMSTSMRAEDDDHE